MNADQYLEKLLACGQQSDVSQLRLLATQYLEDNEHQIETAATKLRGVLTSRMNLKDFLRSNDNSSDALAIAAGDLYQLEHYATGPVEPVTGRLSGRFLGKALEVADAGYQAYFRAAAIAQNCPSMGFEDTELETLFLNVIPHVQNDAQRWEVYNNLATLEGLSPDRKQDYIDKLADVQQ